MFVKAARHSTSGNAKLVAASMTVVNLAGVDVASYSDCTEGTCVPVDRHCGFDILRTLWCSSVGSYLAILFYASGC